MASWFETRGVAALLTMRGDMVRDCQCAALIERSTASLGQQSTFNLADF
jgi:hypothetical protein